MGVLTLLPICACFCVLLSRCLDTARLPTLFICVPLLFKSISSIQDKCHNNCAFDALLVMTLVQILHKKTYCDTIGSSNSVESGGPAVVVVSVIV